MDAERWSTALALGAARTVPLVWLVPAFGGPALPAAVRTGLGLALALLALPHLASYDGPSSATGWGWLITREVFVGVTLGFAATVSFRAAEAAGRLVDTFRGATMSDALSPLSGERTSPLGQLYLHVCVLLFVSLGGLGHLATALAHSYEAVPVTLQIGARARAGAATLVMATSAHLIEAAVGLAAPVMVTLLLADLVLGMLGRMVPNLSLFFLGMPLKALLGLGLVLLGLGGLSAALTDGLRGTWTLVNQAISVWR